MSNYLVTFIFYSKTNNNTYALDISGNQQIKKILDALYSSSTLESRLERKYERYLKLCDQQANRRINRENYFLND